MQGHNIDDLVGHSRFLGMSLHQECEHSFPNHLPDGDSHLRKYIGWAQEYNPMSFLIPGVTVTSEGIHIECELWSNTCSSTLYSVWKNVCCESPEHRCTALSAPSHPTTYHWHKTHGIITGQHQTVVTKEGYNRSAPCTCQSCSGPANIKHTCVVHGTITTMPITVGREIAVLCVPHRCLWMLLVHTLLCVARIEAYYPCVDCSWALHSAASAVLWLKVSNIHTVSIHSPIPVGWAGQILSTAGMGFGRGCFKGAVCPS